MGEKISYDINDKGVAVLTINNPPMNALDELTMLELEFIIHQIEVNNDVKAVVITGEGGNFVVGADVNKVKEIDSEETGISLSSRAHEILDLIENLRKPVIAAINGSCLGGGLELALACHLRIAGDQVQLGLPEIMLGIMPAFGGTQRSLRCIGVPRALDIMLTGRFVGAEEAEKIGLINKVVPQDKVLEEALSMAKGFSYKSTLAAAAILEAVIDGSKLNQEDGLKLESKCFGKLCNSEDMKEGIAAFFEKRKPQFKGK